MKRNNNRAWLFCGIVLILALAAPGCRRAGDGSSKGGAARRAAAATAPAPVKAPGVAWQHFYGNPGEDVAVYAEEVPGRGFVAAGTTMFGTGRDDALLLRLDDSGKQTDRKILPGAAEENVAFMASSHGGWLLAGSSGDMAAGNFDFRVAQLDRNMNALWDKTFGGAAWDIAYAALPTADGGCIVVGLTHSKGNGQGDGWILKLNKNGQRQWDRKYGGENKDEFTAVAAAPGGGWFVAGSTASTLAGDTNAWLVKLGADGRFVWEKKYGGDRNDDILAMAATGDGGVILAGKTESSGAGKEDALLLRVAADGRHLWSKTSGGPETDTAAAVAVTHDGGFIIAGGTDSFGGGNTDGRLVRFDKNGAELWSRAFGGKDWDTLASVRQTADNGFIAAGTSKSHEKDTGDIWIIRLTPEKSGGE